MTTEMFNVSPAATQSGSRIRKTVTRGLLVAAMTGGLAFGMAMPAFADGTTTTFSITPGTLSISVPTSAGLPAVATGVTSITGPLGEVIVTDARGDLLPWTLTAESSTFTKTTPLDEASTSTEVTYATGVVAPSGVVTLAGFPEASIMLPEAVVTATGVSGNNTATFNPILTVTLPDRALAGGYTGTVTTSIA